MILKTATTQVDQNLINKLQNKTQVLSAMVSWLARRPS